VKYKIINEVKRIQDFNTNNPVDA